MLHTAVPLPEHAVEGRLALLVLDLKVGIDPVPGLVKSIAVLEVAELQVLDFDENWHQLRALLVGERDHLVPCMIDAHGS